MGVISKDLHSPIFNIVLLREDSGPPNQLGYDVEGGYCRTAASEAMSCFYRDLQVEEAQKSLEKFYSSAH